MTEIAADVTRVGILYFLSFSTLLLEFREYGIAPKQRHLRARGKQLANA